LSGWTSSLSDPKYINPVTGLPTVLYSSPPSFNNNFNVPVPEASAVLILVTELSLLAGVLYLFRRRLNWKRFDP
jgi:hypothetical protein